jgi:AcrR family transcriptional regulator
MSTSGHIATNGEAAAGSSPSAVDGSQNEPAALPSHELPRRSRLAVDQRRAELLRLGQELFGLHNYDELSIDEIARAARISKGLLYHYFPSKRDYYVEVIRSCAGELLSLHESARREGSADGLLACIDGYLDYVYEHAKPFASVLRARLGFDPDVCSIVEATRQAFLSRLLAALPDEASPQMRNALRGFIGFVEGAVLDWLDHGDLSREELRALLVEMASRTVLLVRGSAESCETTIDTSIGVEPALLRAAPARG